MFGSSPALSNKFWPMALIAFLDASNCVPNTKTEHLSPEYYLTGRHPDVERRFRYFFGQQVVSVVLKADKIAANRVFTFTPSGETGYAVGSIAHNYATVVYIPSRSLNGVFIRKDVRPIKTTEYTPRDDLEIASMMPIFPSVTECDFPDFMPLLPPIKESLEEVLPTDEKHPDVTVSLASVTSSISPFGDASIPPVAPVNDTPPSDDPRQWKDVPVVGVRARGGADSTQAIKKRHYTKLCKERALSKVRAYHTRSCDNVVTAIIATTGKESLPLEPSTYD